MLPNKFNILGKVRSSVGWNTRIPMIGPMGEPTNILYRPRKFSPKRIANLAAWYDASDLSSLIYDGSNRVSLWADKSGNSNGNVFIVNGQTGNYAKTPSTAALQITGDLDLSTDQALNTWTPASNDIILAKGSSVVPANLEYMLQISTLGNLVLFWSTGAATLSATSTAVPTVSAYGRLSVRATLQVNNGAGGWTVTFYTATTFGLWVQLGNTVTGAGTTSIQASSNELAIDAFSGGVGGNAAGIVYRVQIRNGIGGTIVFDDNFGLAGKLSATHTEQSANAATVTVATSGDLGARISGARDLYQGTVANQPVLNVWSGTNYGYLNGVAGNYFSIPNAAPIQITGDIEMVFDGAATDWTPASAVALIARRQSGATAANSAYQLTLNSDGTISALVSNGTTNYSVTSTVAPTVSDGARLAVKASVDVDNGAGGKTVTFYTASTYAGPWVQLGTPVVNATAVAINNNGDGIGIGSVFGGLSNVFNGKIYRAQIYNGINGTLAFDFNPATYVSGTTFTDSSSNAATITINGGATVVTRTGLYFDGSNDYLKAAAWAMAQPETIYQVWSTVGAWATSKIVHDGGSINTTRLEPNTATPKYRIYAGASLGDLSLSLLTPIVTTEVYNGASSAFRQNRGTAITGNTGSGAANGFTLGAIADSTSPANITASEILIYNAAHDTPTQNQIIAYLGAKWGITV